MNAPGVEILLDGALVVTMDADRPLISNGWVGISGDRIAAVGSGARPMAIEVVDRSGDVILPGFVNAHAHVLGAFVRGMGGDRSTSVAASSDRPTVAVRLAMDDADAYAAARLALLEMQLSGVTTIADSQPALSGLEAQADGTLRALVESGMHAVFYRASVNRTDFFPAVQHDGIDLAAAEIDRLIARHRTGRVSIGVEPMALHRVSDGLLRQLIALSRDLRIPLAIHGPYAEAAAAHARQRWGKSVVGVLADFEALGRDLLMHHPVVLDDGDIELLVDTETATSVCTVDNLLIGSRPAPLPSLLDAGVRVGVGLDQPNDGHDMFQLLKVTMLAQRMGGGSWGSPEQMLELGTSGGARALGVPTGVIETGAWADLVVVDGSHPAMRPRHSVVSNLVLAAGPHVVKEVYTRGVRTVSSGRHLVWDQDEIVAAADEAMRRCLARAGLSERLWTDWQDG